MLNVKIAHPKEIQFDSEMGFSSKKICPENDKKSIRLFWNSTSNIFKKRLCFSVVSLCHEVMTKTELQRVPMKGMLKCGVPTTKLMCQLCRTVAASVCKKDREIQKFRR